MLRMSLLRILLRRVSLSMHVKILNLDEVSSSSSTYRTVYFIQHNCPPVMCMSNFRVNVLEAVFGFPFLAISAAHRISRIVIVNIASRRDNGYDNR